MNKVCAVIVTYGNRFHLLKQVIDSCFENKIDKILIVDNGSHIESKRQMKKYKNKYTNKIQVIHLSKNLGSAGGFKIGIKTAYKDPSVEYILLLDDDNVLSKKFFENLREIVNSYSKIYQKDSVAFSSYRLFSDLSYLQITKNTFLGFHIKHITKKIRKVLFNTAQHKIMNINTDDKRIYDVEHAVYGGLIFHKSLIEKYGLPDERLILYGDDTEYTYRITSNGGKIFLLLSCTIKDVEIRHGGEAKKMFSTTLINLDKSKCYYSIRNFSYFETHFKKNNTFIRAINQSIYLSILYFLCFIHKKKDRFKLIMEAVKDGKREILGYNPKYPLN